MANPAFIPDKRLEAQANDLLVRYERQFGPIKGPPVPVERIIEDVLDLNILWDAIEELPGTSTFARLDPNLKTIVLNEARREVVESTLGLYSTILGHEGGHWEIHVDKTLLQQPSFPEISKEFSCEYRSEGPGQGPREIQAHKFMSFLLMPTAMLLQPVQAVNLLQWPNLYELRETFGVTISSLTIRLQNLGLLFVADDGTLHRSRQEYLGQQRLL